MWWIEHIRQKAVYCAVRHCTTVYCCRRIDLCEVHDRLTKASEAYRQMQTWTKRLITVINYNKPLCKLAESKVSQPAGRRTVLPVARLPLINTSAQHQTNTVMKVGEEVLSKSLEKQIKNKNDMKFNVY